MSLLQLGLAGRPVLKLFNFLGDTYATLVLGEKLKGGALLSVPEIGPLRKPGILFKRLVVVESCPPHSSSSILRIDGPAKEFAIPASKQSLRGERTREDWQPCPWPTSGYIPAAAHLASLPDIRSQEFWFGELPKKVRRQGPDDWSLTTGHLPPTRALKSKLPRIGARTFGPVTISVMDAEVTGYLVDAGDWHFVVFAGMRFCNAPRGDSHVSRILTHYWDDTLLRDASRSSYTDEEAEDIRLDLLRRIGRSVSLGEAFLPSGLGVDVVEVDSDSQELRYRSFDGSLMAPVRSCINGVIASLLASRDLNLISNVGYFLVRSPFEYYPSATSDTLRSNLSIYFDEETGWHITAPCEFILGAAGVKQ
jgi:hypothetical protein